MAISKLDGFHVPYAEHLLAGIVHNARPLWKLFGKIESDSNRQQIESTPIDRPIYIAGLARSGSTVLLEMLATHTDMVTHQYRDFLTIFTPYWFARASQRFTASSNEPVERSHGDRVMVTPESPEAMEEMIWMTFFPNLHDPTQSNVLDGETKHDEFSQFYRDHIRKLLIARDGKRYASKGNYNTTRLEFIDQLVPDARFVIPIRDPVDHIASLQKQHQLLSQAAKQHRRSVTYLNRVGHFEFGVNRRPVHTGNDDVTRSVLACWNNTDEVRGWACYWSSIYGYVADLLDRNPAIRERTIVVRYEELCDESEDVLPRIFDHCQLRRSHSIIDAYSDKLSKPTYYDHEFTDQQKQVIESETAEVAARFGYDLASLAC